MTDAAAGPEYTNRYLENRKLIRFCRLFVATAAVQGRIAYLVMSIHAVNPYILQSVTNFKIDKYLFANMVYGVGVYVFFRPSMRSISIFTRVAFSILGSMMFNYSSMLVYDWLVLHFANRPYVLTVAGYLCGRIMMLHLLAYLYHVDSRERIHRMRNVSEYDSMYRNA